MATIHEALAIAIQHHQAGRLQAAEQLYCQILQVDANQPDALHLLGVIAHHSGNHEAAAELIRRAIQLHGNSPEFHYNLANAYTALKKTSEAIACYQRVIELKPTFAEAHYNLGNSLKEQLKLDDAIACYLQAVQLRSNFVEALFNLAASLAEKGNLVEAVGYYDRLLELQAGDLEALDNLALLLIEMGRLPEAISRYRRVLELKPDNAALHYRLANLLMKQGSLNDAVLCYRRAIALKPDFAEAFGSLGTVFKMQGHLDEALASYRQAVQWQPHNPFLQNNLGLLLQERQALVEAIASFYRAAELKPDYADAYSNLGNALREQGVPAEAILCYRRVLELKPDDADAYNKLGNALRDLTRLEEAIACYRRAVELKSNFAEAHNNLGNVLKESGQMCEAVASYQRAIELKPDFAVALNNLGVVLNGLGRNDESIDSYRKALEVQPNYAGAHSNLLMTLQYCDGITLAALAEAHAEFNRQHGAPLMPATSSPKRVNQRLRVGFVSADLGRHPVGYFLVSIFENLRQHGIETVCYSQRIVKDDFTQRFQSAASKWLDVIGMTDEQLAEQIRADRIDILFDLAGHTARNRALVFARKPAPIQIAWIGYEGTTGLTAMDYLIADHRMIPPLSDQYYQEIVLRMPDGYVCYEPPAMAPDVGRLPLATNGYVTFGSFNNPAKFTTRVIDVWSEILRRRPNSRLVLKYRGLAEPAVKQRFLDAFIANGVASERLDLLPQSSYADYLLSYGQIDVALDPFPFTGGATTCEALWMGVPVITFPGETFAGRHSLSHLHNIGLSELVVENLDDYVQLAVSLTDDVARLTELRATLRQKMVTSPLCDAARFAAQLVRVLRDLWERA